METTQRTEKRILSLIAALLVVAPSLQAQVGPGDSIGYSFYDFLQSGSANRNLINYNDGTLTFARMAAIDSMTDTRGTYYKCFDGAAWSEDWERLEESRTGWGNIDRLDTETELVVSHVDQVRVFRRCDLNPWSQSTLFCTEDIWMRVAASDDYTVHVIGTAGPVQVGYHRSTDAGATWECDRFLVTEQEVVVDADSYDITSQGENVAIVVAGAGGDVVVLESTDGGEAWTETLVYDIDATGLTPGDQPADGSCSIIYDSNGDLHAAWGCYEIGEDGLAEQSVNAPIRHWGEKTGVAEVAFPDPDTTIVDPGGRDGNFASQPDLAADQSGNVIIVYSSFIPETDSRGKYYEHVFATVSSDGGETWSGSIDLTPGSGFDAAFPSVADLADEYLHFTYTSDPFAGNWLQGTHEQIAVSYMYHKVPVDSILNTVSVDDFPDIPHQAELYQNYPNPFNPATTFSFLIPQSSIINLTVYDLLGRQVATVVNERLAPGRYTRQWDAAGLPSGVYYYRMTAGSYVETKKLVLLR